jgi:hypothetical protein
MGLIAQIRFRLLPIWALLLPVLLPTVAWAGWGDENWGTMVWGGTPTASIPSLSGEGITVLAVLLLGLSYWLLAARRRRAKRSPLNS